MIKQYQFPFGQPVRIMKQQDCSQKDFFVLGVYASAVHARWIGADSQINIAALAVASEPYIFWRGERADKIIKRIRISPEIGRLEPALKHLNGPSGKTLDKYFLEPLGITREQAWLCDLVPHSCRNSGQQKALEREYFPLAKQFDLPPVTLPPVPNKLTNEKRCNEIVDEIEVAKPQTLILLGDEPIKWFLSYFDSSWSRLSDFGQDEKSYGGLHLVQIRNKTYYILPLVHPRQAAKLGAYTQKWAALHESWIKKKSN